MNMIDTSFWVQVPSTGRLKTLNMHGTWKSTPSELSRNNQKTSFPTKASNNLEFFRASNPKKKQRKQRKKHPSKQKKTKTLRWVFLKMVVPPNHPILTGVFHYKPSILGYHYFWKHPGVFFWERIPVTFRPSDACFKTASAAPHVAMGAPLESMGWFWAAGNGPRQRPEMVGWKLDMFGSFEHFFFFGGGWLWEKQNLLEKIKGCHFFLDIFHYFFEGGWFWYDKS